MPYPTALSSYFWSQAMTAQRTTQARYVMACSS